MNKSKISDVLGIGVLCLIFCIGISVIAKKAFEIDSDFLSASATLFTAFVAFYLYNDWRDQQKFILIEKHQTLLNNSGESLQLKYAKFFNFFRTLDIERDSWEQNFGSEIAIKQTYVNVYQELYLEVVNTITHLCKYSICLSDLNIKHLDHIAEVKVHIDNLVTVKNHLDKVEEQGEFVKKLVKGCLLCDPDTLGPQLQKFKDQSDIEMLLYLNLILKNKGQ